MPIAFLGIGTGRCGTVSLARIVDACRNTRVTHENPAVRSPWDGPDEAAFETFANHVRWCLNEGLTVGDVALYWLPHVARIRELLSDVRVVCLKRDRAATIASLERKCPGYTLVRPEDRRHNPEWWDLFPTVDGATPAEAWARYYDRYYADAAKIPGVLHVATEELDDDRALTRIFDHLEIPADDRVYLPERHHNTGSETVVARSRLDGAPEPISRSPIL